MVHHAGDFRQALGVCDGLRQDQPRRECQDGVFMERAIRAIGATPINVGDGPGIAQATNLFVPFFTTKLEGSGIGLVLCRQIAENHRGSLRLENRTECSGCIARLRLPL